MEIFYTLYESVLYYLWIAYGLNLLFIVYLFSKKRDEIKKLINKFEPKEKIIILAFFILVFAIGAIFVQKNHYAVASEAWYDTYAGKELSHLNFEYLRYYKYGPVYPYTIALLFLFSSDVSIISYFSLFCFLVSMAFIFLSLYNLTNKKFVSYISLLVTSSMYIILRHAFIYQGKEIFTFLAVTAFFFSLSLLYKKYDFKKLMLCLLILFFSINLRYEMINLFFTIPIVLLLSKTKLRRMKNDFTRLENTPLLMLVLFIFLITSIVFLRYYSLEHFTGAYPRAYLNFGSDIQGYVKYMGENSLILVNFLLNNVIFFLPLSLIGLFLYFRKYKKEISFILLFGFFCLLPYLAYFPYVIEERYLISFSLMFIALASIGSGMLLDFIKNRNFRFIFAVFIMLIFIITLSASLKEIEPIMENEYYRHQDVRLNLDVLDKIPANQSSFIITTNWNTKFLIKTINDNPLYTIFSFDQSDGFVVRKINEMFYYENLTEVNSTYPFIMDIDRPTYFIYDLYCEQDDFKTLPFLCDALLNKRFDSQLIYQNDIFKLYSIYRKSSIDGISSPL